MGHDAVATPAPGPPQPYRTRSDVGRTPAFRGKLNNPSGIFRGSIAAQPSPGYALRVYLPGDVANKMGPAVGANALRMGGALIIAAVFETAGR